MRRILQLLVALAGFALLCSVVAVGLFYALILRDLPTLESLDDYRPNLVTRVYSADGAVIAEIAKERREIVAIETVPDYLLKAFVAAEDDAFYTHAGLDYLGIARAAWANLRAGGVVQGGSTITQQVAKTFLLTSERSYIRKIKDMVLAQRIEQHLDKNEILYLYLNQIYLGSGAYGVEAAAQTYFGKSVEELSLAEGALIAGVVPAPSRYTPFNNPEHARTRQTFVLRRMLDEDYITSEEHEEALAEPLVLVERAVDEDRRASAFFTEEVRRYLVNRFGEDEVLTGGLVVRTTLRLADQRGGYASLREGLRAHERRTGFRGPLREVAEDAREAELERLSEANGEAPWRSGQLLEALVMSVDDKAGKARLALGGGAETTLTLEDIEWARKPDPSVDGLAVKLDRVSRALEVGYLVRLYYRGEELREGSDDPAPVFELYQEPEAEGALLALDVDSGHVVALVGGYSFDRSQFDRALQSRRQPGSAFKPIVYAAALEEGYTPGTIVYDTPFVSDNTETGFVWKPQNYSEKFYGPILLREALAKSRNLATLNILHDIGVRPVINMARTLGVEGPLGYELGVGLGQNESTLAEMVRVYATFASMGRRVDPVFILEVRDRDDQLLDSNVGLLRDDAELDVVGPPRPPSALDTVLGDIRDNRPKASNGHDGDEPGKRPLPEGHVIEPETAYLMTDLLRAVVQNGTGWRAKALGRPVAGKTGTTNDMHDAWFIGFTPDTVAGVWVGYDSARSLGRNESGSRAASPIFVDFMKRALVRRPVRDFAVPDGILFIRMDKKTGLLAAPGTDDYLFQPFADGTAPTEVAHSNGAGSTPGLNEPRLD